MKATAVNYQEVGFMGGDLQFMLWFVAAIIFVFACARDSALHEKLFPHRPSIYRTWRTTTLLVTVLLILAVPAGDRSRADHLARNIDLKYENIKATSEELVNIIGIYNRGRGDQLVIRGYDGDYFLIANGDKEPTVTKIPGSDNPAPKVRPEAVVKESDKK